MDHSNVYQQLINNAQARKEIDDYTEKHHIIPKAFGGSNDENNLVSLTAREHFIAHLLLAKIYGGAMISAAYLMMYQNKRKYNNKEYAWLKEEFSIRNKNRNVSDESKKRMSISAKNRNKSKEKREVWNKGLTRTAEEKQLMSQNRKGKTAGEKHPLYGKHLSESTKKKISEANRGRISTDEYRAKMSQIKKGNQALLGHIHSTETKAKMSETRTKKFTEEETTQIINLRNNGYSYQYIGDKMHCHRNTISKFLRSIG